MPDRGGFREELRSGIVEGYRFLDHVTDAFVEAWGPSLERAFALAGLALFETMVYLEKVNATKRERLRVNGHDREELLYNWLEALLLKFEIDNMVYAEFDVKPIRTLPTEFSLEAFAKGEQYVEAKHGRKVGVKGVTYHQMSVNVELEGRPARVQFLLDL